MRLTFAGSGALRRARGPALCRFAAAAERLRRHRPGAPRPHRAQPAARPAPRRDVGPRRSGIDPAALDLDRRSARGVGTARADLRWRIAPGRAGAALPIRRSRDLSGLERRRALGEPRPSRPQPAASRLPFRGCRIRDGEHDQRPSTAPRRRSPGSAPACASASRARASGRSSPARSRAPPTGCASGFFPRQAGAPFELQGGEQKTFTVFLCVAPEGEADLAWVHDPLVAVPAAGLRRRQRRVRALRAGAGGSSRRVPAPGRRGDRRSALVLRQARGDRRVRLAQLRRHLGGSRGDVLRRRAAGDLALQQPVRPACTASCCTSRAAATRAGSSSAPRSPGTSSTSTSTAPTPTSRPTTAGCSGTRRTTTTPAAPPTAATAPTARAPRDRRRYGGGPSCEHVYTTGLLYFHFLTGDPAARAAVLQLADWVLRMDDGTHSLLGYVDPGPTGLASYTRTFDYHGPGRGAGNSINALLDAYRLTGRAALPRQGRSADRPLHSSARRAGAARARRSGDALVLHGLPPGARQVPRPASASSVSTTARSPTRAPA